MRKFRDVSEGETFQFAPSSGDRNTYVKIGARSYRMQGRETRIVVGSINAAVLPATLRKPFEFEQWHAWQGVAQILLSDESAKKLQSFKDVDECVNWLFLNGHKPAARALNAHAKG